MRQLKGFQTNMYILPLWSPRSCSLDGIYITYYIKGGTAFPSKDGPHLSFISLLSLLRSLKSLPSLKIKISSLDSISFFSYSPTFLSPSQPNFLKELFKLADSLSFLSFVPHLPPISPASYDYIKTAHPLVATDSHAIFLISVSIRYGIHFGIKQKTTLLRAFR